MWKMGLSLGAALALTVATSAQPPNAAPARAADPALAAVPTDSCFFVSVKVSKVWDNPATKSLRDWTATQKEGPLDGLIGLQPAQIDRVTLFAASWSDLDRGEPLVLITTREQYNEAKVLKLLGAGRGNADGPRLFGRAAQLERSEFQWVVFVDDRTLLFLPRRFGDKAAAPNLLGQLIARRADGPLAPALRDAETHDVTVAVDVRGFQTFLGEAGVRANPEFAPFVALLKAKTATFHGDLDKTAKMTFTMSFPDADTAKRAGPVLEEGMKTITEVFAQEVRKREGRTDAIESVMMSWVTSVLKGAKVTADGSNVVATADVPFAGDLAKLVAALPKSLRDSANASTATNNLKQLGLAFHNHESAMARLPSDAYGDPRKPMAMSWRVQILPYIEQDNLYRQLTHQKPWDDPLNLKLLESFPMPKVFEIPGRPAPKGHTYFRVISFPKGAKGTEQPIFTEGAVGPSIVSITDGTSNTFMIVEAEEAVPWYKPDVLAYDGKLPVPKLGDKDARTFLVCMGDGSVRAVRKTIKEATLRALITRAGGEVISDPDW